MGYAVAVEEATLAVRERAEVGYGAYGSGASGTAEAAATEPALRSRPEDVPEKVRGNVRGKVPDVSYETGERGEPGSGDAVEPGTADPRSRERSEGGLSPETSPGKLPSTEGPAGPETAEPPHPEADDPLRFDAEVEGEDADTAAEILGDRIATLAAHLHAGAHRLLVLRRVFEAAR